jgi:rhodanese-related sulfurtransferase
MATEKEVIAMSDTITCETLQQRIDKGALVVDVLTPEDYAACHLVGARNACIYEMVFLDRIAECAPDRTTELILYDATDTTRTAELARERLLEAGYANVSILAGGLAAWRAAGLPVESGEGAAMDEPLLHDGRYLIDTENSRLEWIGRNLNNRHYGRIDVRSGELVIAGRRPSAASIVADMRSIADLDLQDPTWRDLLQSHLKSQDFFAVEQFPTSSLTLIGWETLGDSPQAVNGTATGDLTIRDVTRRISFPAIVAAQPDGSIKAHAAFDIDRTLWNVNYGSSRFFERLGMHLVHDMVSVELFAVAMRAG